MNRRRFVGYSAIGAAAIAAGDMLVEPHRLETTFHKVPLNASASSDRVRVVQISDLHLNHFGSHEAHISAVARNANPDIILITGDSLDHREDAPLLEQFMSTLDRDVPKLAILGNWEYWSEIDIGALSRLYDRFNCRLLVNESATVDVGPGRIRFVGLDDLVGGRPAPQLAFADRSDVSAEIILAHCPEHRQILRDHASLMISGHTHGGQVTAFGWAPFLPKGCGGYNRGWYPAGNSVKGPLYVSRGLGTSLIPFRMGSIPEVAVFDLLV
jgi:predicted MPP superfamily phosphohydrolase